MPSPKKGVAYTFDTALQDMATIGALRANPTLATGDVKISKDGGAFANLTTLPTVSPASGRVVAVALSATEMTADRLVIQFVDQTVPAEWGEAEIPIQTNTVTIDELAQKVWDVLESAIATASSIGLKLKTNIDAAISTRATPGQILTTPAQTLATDGSGRVTVGSNADKTGYKLASDGLDTVAAPTDVTGDSDARSSFVKMVRAMFNRFFNEVRQTSSQQLVRDDGGTVRQTMSVSDDGTTQTKGKSA